MFPESEILSEERATIEEMADLDFVFCLHAASKSQALLEHELAHVLYRTDSDHRESVNAMWIGLEDTSRVVCTTYLLDCGYKEEEFQDEFFAAFFDGYPELISLMPEAATLRANETQDRKNRNGSEQRSSSRARSSEFAVVFVKGSASEAFFSFCQVMGDSRATGRDRFDLAQELVCFEGCVKIHSRIFDELKWFYRSMGRGIVPVKL
ncbi:MAG: hypothetical protein JNM27_11335 [Leptospirales bacterium]|nr:hypothetical protein [Leptospirales bacterium]